MKQRINTRPISVNECWQGRRFATKKYKDFTTELIYSLKKIETMDGKLSVRIKLFLKSPARRDLDNIAKPIIDCLQKKGWIKNDNKIYKLYLEKEKSKQDGFEIEVISYDHTL